MPDVVINFATAGEAKVVRAWAAQSLAIREQNKRLGETYEATRKAESGMDKFLKGSAAGMVSLKESLQSALSALTGFSVGGGGIAAGIVGLGVNEIVQNMRHEQQRKEATRVATLPVADAYRHARINFQADDSMADSQLDERLDQIAARTRSPKQLAAAAFASASSAKGNKSNEAAAAAVETTLRLLPGDADVAAILPGRILDVEKMQDSRRSKGDAGASSDPEAIAGMLLEGMVAARQTKLQQFAPNAVQAMAGGMGYGDTAERSLETFSAITQMIPDEEGNVARTVAINLYKQLDELKHGTKKFRELMDDKKSKKLDSEVLDQHEQYAKLETPTEQIEFLQQNSELGEMFLEHDSFRAQGDIGIQEMMRNSPRWRETIKGARATINPVDDAAKASYHKKLGELEGGKYQQTLTTNQESDANIEETKTARTHDQRSATAKKIFDDTLENTSTATIGYTQSKLRLASEKLNRDSSIPELSRMRELQRMYENTGQLSTYKSAGGLGSVDETTRGKLQEDRKLIAKQYEALRQQAAAAGVDLPGLMQSKDLGGDYTPRPKSNLSELDQAVVDRNEARQAADRAQSNPKLTKFQKSQFEEAADEAQQLLIEAMDRNTAETRALAVKIATNTEATKSNTSANSGGVERPPTEPASQSLAN
ncbi:MAG: hypothetical protein ACKV2Q_24785 [Planctomycetaceae bacterium]